ncbi:MAG: L-aspartate oxidase [Bacteroidetes bacterium]|nr:L-aspartate oxidase [Bacteroidota bacterium]MBU1423621.1 L-aspartate oxidase [Bacteroidota bacterium]MBU2471439.1 L-aspartate oxidase [Bacteroidota bacterium]
MEIKTDYLVIGSGIAGLSYALYVAEFGKVAIITKKAKAESNTNYAQGGIASVLAPDDSFNLHIQDTLEAGSGLCHKDAVEILVTEGPQRLRELIDVGVQFTAEHGHLDLGREGGHSRNRIVHAKDLTGREIERALLHRIAEHPNIQVFENHLAIDLITQHHLGLGIDKDRPINCWGAYVLDVNINEVKKFIAGITLLSTGGLGHVYLHTTNPSIATGDGVAMAYRAGAYIGNMEFIQFHPTTLYDSGSPAFLISEAVRGFGAYLRTKDGERFMHKYDSRNELAPRDIVARAIDTELKKRGDEYVNLDLRHLPPDDVKSKFPYIYITCLEKYKIDITKELIPVVPAAHYSCGGVITDVFGKTNVHGLLACGEAAMTGVHGANRLASNSLLEAIVFSYRAANTGREFILTNKTKIPDIPEWDDSGTFNAEEWVLVSHDRREIQEIMWDYVGIVRSDLRLDRAFRRIDFIKYEIEKFYKRTKVTEGLIELRNLALIAKLIIHSAMVRKESRGLHYTTDYTQKDDINWKRDTIISVWE